MEEPIDVGLGVPRMIVRGGDCSDLGEMDIMTCTNSVNFFRKLGVSLTQLRMENQWSEDLHDAASDLDITIEFISTEAKRANCAE